MNFFIIFALIAIFSSTGEGKDITIIYSGSTFGELKPCGCSEEGDMGGLARRATFFQQERKSDKDLILLDGGDNLSTPSEQSVFKNQAMLEGMKEMNYQAVIFGEKDFTLGVDFLKKNTIPWLAANISFPDDFPNKINGYLIKEFPEEKIKIGIVGLLDPELFYLDFNSGIKIENPLEALPKYLKIFQENEVNFVIVLGHLKNSLAKKLAEVKEVEVIINGHLEDENINPPKKEALMVGNKIIADVYESGKGMGKLTLAVKDKKVTGINNEYIVLTQKFPDDEKQTALYADYNEKVMENFKLTLEKKTQAEQSDYQGEKVCRSCHEKEATIWAASRHARAFVSLQKKNKHYDPECIICHTTGFKKNGFMSDLLTPDLANVQCEMCHGPGKAHVASPDNTYGKKAKEACVTCHTPKNSPMFDQKKYWEKIKH